MKKMAKTDLERLLESWPGEGKVAPSPGRVPRPGPPGAGRTELCGGKGPGAGDRPGIPPPDLEPRIPPCARTARPPRALGRSGLRRDPGHRIRSRRHVRGPRPGNAGAGLHPGHVGLPAPDLDVRRGEETHPRDGRSALRPGRRRRPRAAAGHLRREPRRGRGRRPGLPVLRHPRYADQSPLQPRKRRRRVRRPGRQHGPGQRPRADRAAQGGPAADGPAVPHPGHRSGPPRRRRGDRLPDRVLQAARGEGRRGAPRPPAPLPARRGRHRHVHVGLDRPAQGRVVLDLQPRQQALRPRGGPAHGRAGRGLPELPAALPHVRALPRAAGLDLLARHLRLRREPLGRDPVRAPAPGPSDGLHQRPGALGPAPRALPGEDRRRAGRGRPDGRRPRGRRPAHEMGAVGGGLSRPPRLPLLLGPRRRADERLRHDGRDRGHHHDPAGRLHRRLARPAAPRPEGPARPGGRAPGHGTLCRPLPRGQGARRHHPLSVGRSGEGFLARDRGRLRAAAQRLLPDRRPDQGHLQEQPRPDRRAAQDRGQVRRRAGDQADLPRRRRAALQRPVHRARPERQGPGPGPGARVQGEQPGVLPAHRHGRQRRPGPLREGHQLRGPGPRLQPRQGRDHGQGLVQPQAHRGLLRDGHRRPLPAPRRRPRRAGPLRAHPALVLPRPGHPRGRDRARPRRPARPQPRPAPAAAARRGQADLARRRPRIRDRGRHPRPRRLRPPARPLGRQSLAGRLLALQGGLGPAPRTGDRPAVPPPPPGPDLSAGGDRRAAQARRRRPGPSPHAALRSCSSRPIRSPTPPWRRSSASSTNRPCGRRSSSGPA